MLQLESSILDPQLGEMRNLGAVAGFVLLAVGVAGFSFRSSRSGDTPTCPPRPVPLPFPNDEIPPALAAAAAVWEAGLKAAIDAGTAPSVQYYSM